MAGAAPIAIGPGTVIAGTYEVTEVIGRGGMGAVWAARHLRLPGKLVAIKVLLGTGVGEQALARFRREAEIASRIGHPNIVEVQDFNLLEDGTPYQVLEYLDGESLGQRLRRGPIPLGETVELVLQIGSALRAAHRAGVVHRDLKPDNIFLCPTDAGGVIHDRVKILDFGISKIRGSQTLQTQESVLIGTPQYMSPEQASGKNQEVDQRTDVFALGAIVYEMLAGRPAFSGDSVVSVILDVVQGVPTPLNRLVPSLPAEVDRAVARALAKRPDERFAEIADFVTALTGRTLQTLGNDARGTGRGSVARAASPGPAAGSGSGSSSGAGRPLSAEEMVGETMAPPPSLPGPGVGGGTAIMPQGSTGAPSTVVAPGRDVAVAAGATQAASHVPVVSRRAARSRTPMFLGLAVVALGLIAAGVWVPRMKRGDTGDKRDNAEPSPSTSRAPAAPATSRVVTGVGADPTPAAAATPAPGEARPVATPDAGGAPHVPPAPAVAKREVTHAGHAVAESIPPEVAAQLSEADRLLDAGDAGEAIRKARQSFFTQKTDRGWALLARAFCAQGDLENAKASLRNVRAGSPERSRATRACKSKGIDLR